MEAPFVCVCTCGGGAATTVECVCPYARLELKLPLRFPTFSLSPLSSVCFSRCVVCCVWWVEWGE